MRAGFFFAMISACVGYAHGALADAQDPEAWALHGQVTFVWQYHPAFISPYRGPNSLDPGSRGDALSGR